MPSALAIAEVSKGRMWERKQPGQHSDNAAREASRALSPGKSTPTSQLPVASSSQEVDRPAPQNARESATASPSLRGSSFTTTAPAASEPDSPAASGSGDRSLSANRETDAPPVEQYVVPFDRTPKSVAGERVIFAATYTHATPGDFKLVYTSLGGHFDAQGSGIHTKTFPGLYASNIDWYIDAGWNATSAVAMKLEVQKIDGTAVTAVSWTFGKKTYHPTSITQQEGEDERDNPAVYTYKLGPNRRPGHDDYVGFTILEAFGPYRSNLSVADIKPPYAAAHGLDSDAKIVAHFFPGSSDHGTFTVSPGDRIADQHGGLVGADEAKAQLVGPKQIEKSIDQTYESNAGTALGRYTITRILKPDGSRKITKKKL